MSKDIEEQLNLAHEWVDLVDRANMKVCVTLLRYSMEEARELYCSCPNICKEEGG